MVAWVAWVWIFLPAQADPPTYVAGPKPMVEAVRKALRQERPSVPLVASADTAQLHFVLMEQAGRWTLSGPSTDGGTFERLIGSADDQEAAVRVAVLLIVRFLNQEAPDPTALSARQAGLPAGAGSTETSTRPPSQADPHWRAEAGLAGLGWSTPFSVRLGGAAAGYRRFSFLDVGLRVMAVGGCCRIEGDGVNASSVGVSALLDTRWRVLKVLAVTLGIGVGWDRARAQVADSVFRAPGSVETRGRVGGTARVGLQLVLPVASGVDLSLTAGGVFYTSRLVVALPEAFAAGREPLSRGWIVPFLALALGLEML